MGLGLAVIILSKVVQYGLGATVEPTPQPYIAADYYSYNVGLEGTIKNRNPAHSGPIKWKERIEIGPYKVDWPNKPRGKR